jgi:hypothetical protein
VSAKVFFKATRPDGTDFYSGTVAYRVGETVSVFESARRRTAKCCTDSVLHASTVPVETLIGGKWPCRLFEVTGRPVAEEGHKRGFRKLTVLREIDAHLALGPQGEHLAALIQRAGGLSAAGAAAGDAARDAAREAAREAARALVCRDLITPTGFTQDHYDTLTRPWASVIGPVHPDDKPEGVVA